MAAALYYSLLKLMDVGMADQLGKRVNENEWIESNESSTCSLLLYPIGQTIKYTYYQL